MHHYGRSATQHYEVFGIPSIPHSWTLSSACTSAPGDRSTQAWGKHRNTCASRKLALGCCSRTRAPWVTPSDTLHPQSPCRNPHHRRINDGIPSLEATKPSQNSSLRCFLEGRRWFRCEQVASLTLLPPSTAPIRPCLWLWDSSALPAGGEKGQPSDSQHGCSQPEIHHETGGGG